MNLSKHKSPIFDIFYRRLEHDDCEYKSERYRELSAKISEEEKSFLARIKTDPYAVQQYEKMDELKSELDLESAAANFAEGFRCATLLMIDTIKGPFDKDTKSVSKSKKIK